MRFTARSLALTGVSALVLVGLSVPAASAAPTLAVNTAPTYNAASTNETVTGTAMYAGDTVYINLTGGSTTTAPRTTTAGSDGNWTYTFSAADVQSVPDGTVTVTAGEQYCAFLGSPAGPLPCGPLQNSALSQKNKTFLKDVGIPGSPVISAIPGSGTNGVINSSTPATITASGNGEPGATITLTLGNLTASNTVNSQNNWFASFDASSLPDGTYTASATQTDAAGNKSSAGTFDVVRDTVAPRPNGTSPANGATVGPGTSLSFTYHDLLGSNSTVAVTTGSTDVAGTVSVSAGTVSFKPSAALAGGSYTAHATAYDAYGNKVVTTISFTVDASAPTLTNLKSTATSPSVPNTTVTGTVSEASTLTVTSIDGTGAKSATTVSVKAGNFTVSNPENTLAGGTVTVSVKAVDAYGNASTTSAPSHTHIAGTSVTLSVPTWSAVGWPITLSGSVHLVKPNTYGSVTLVHSSLSGKSQILATVGVSSTGSYSFKYTPTTSGTYYAIYNGDSKNSSVTSKTYSSEVRYAISASSASGPATTKALISGAVHNPPSGVYVVIYKKNADGSWTKLGTATVDSTYHYRFSVLLPKGSTAIRVTVAASHGFYGNAANCTATRT